MNELHVINGIEKPFLTWCQECGASALQVRALMSQGMSLEEALQVKIRKHNILIAMNGVIKPQSEWCKQYNIKYHTLRYRVERGMTLQEAFEKPLNMHAAQPPVKKLEYTITKPFLSWCQDYLADPLYVRAAVSTGYSLLYALKNAPKSRVNQLPMKVENQTDTFLMQCRRYKKAANTIRRRVASGVTLEDAFLLPEFRRGETERLTEAGRANEPHSITQPLADWCRDFHQPLCEVQQRLELGLRIEQALTPPELEKVELGGEVIALQDLCSRLDLNLVGVKRRIRQGQSILEAIYETAGAKLKGRVPVNGEALRQARIASGLTLKQIAQRCNEAEAVQLSKHILANMERGTRYVTPLEQQALCAVLGIEPEELCPGLQEV